MNARIVLAIGSLAIVAAIAACNPTAVGIQEAIEMAQPDNTPAQPWSGASADVTGAMTLERLGTLIEERSQDVRSEPGYWEFTVDNIAIACMTDTTFDRMRFVAPIVRLEDMPEEQRAAVLDANFHTALDARYATNNGILYAAFIHPLSPLTDGEVRNGIEQVKTLAQTFGSTYTSGDLTYGN